MIISLSEFDLVGRLAIFTSSYTFVHHSIRHWITSERVFSGQLLRLKLVSFGSKFKAVIKARFEMFRNGLVE